MAEPVETRRVAIGELILSLLGAAALWRFLSPRRAAASAGAIASVPVADVPVGGALVLPQHRCAIVRRADGFVAFDLTCTHLACTVTATTEGFACPCHGSRFGADGRPFSGPAPRPLKRLAIEERDGVLLVRRSSAW